MAGVQLYVGEALARYGFPQGHPFGTDRQGAFWAEAQRRGLDARAQLCAPVQATREELERFHTPAYVERVVQLSARGVGLLDAGDTPAFPGCYDAARPELVLLQCGTDSIGGDPLTHLDLTPACHAQATRDLVALAERHAEGRLLVTGGGGYNRANLAAGWTAVLEALLSA